MTGRRSMARPETRVENNFAKWCRESGLFCLKLSALAVAGFPDRTVILPGGRLACVEFKSDKGKTSPVQDQRIAALRRLDVPVLVTSDANEAKEFIKGLINV
jgi:hypothetical protein